MLLKKNITKSAAKSAKKQTARFPLLGILGLVLLFLLLAYFVFSFGETTESEKLRFQVLKNKCLRGETLEAEEANEFCVLSRQFEPNLLLSQDCSVFFRAYYQAHLSDFLSKSEECEQNIVHELKQAHFIVHFAPSENGKGIVINAEKGNNAYQLRLMHRSSGNPKYRNDYEYMRLNLGFKAGFFTDENAQSSQDIGKTHIKFTTCEDAINLLKMAIAKHQKQ